MKKVNTLLLKQAILQELDQGNKITIKWNCGDDEAIVSIFVNDEEIDCDQLLMEALYFYVINEISLPSAGEFSLEGGGRVKKIKKGVYLEYESHWKEYEYGPLNEDDENTKWEEVEPRWSGKKLLFGV